MVTLRIVEMEGGQFAVQRQRRLLCEWEYLERNKNSDWHIPEYIMEHCFMETLEQAEKSLETIAASFRRNRKPLKIVRVVKKVRV